MSNEQTVRTALCRVAPTTYHANITDDLGIDPDMTVSELQRRLRIAERVLTYAHAKGSPSFGATAAQLHAWLTREDDQ